MDAGWEMKRQKLMAERKLTREQKNWTGKKKKLGRDRAGSGGGILKRFTTPWYPPREGRRQESARLAVGEGDGKLVGGIRKRGGGGPYVANRSGGKLLQRPPLSVGGVSLKRSVWCPKPPQEKTGDHQTLTCEAPKKKGRVKQLDMILHGKIN